MDNSVYEIKTSYIHTDDYGNKGTFFKKELMLCAEYDEVLAQELVDKQNALDEVQEKLDAIGEIFE